MRRAKEERLPVSCDVGVHHVHLCELDLGYFDPHCRLEPPLRSQRDRDALARALADGVVDCLCSDHTPVDEDGKHLPFAQAEPGATGLELLLPLTLKWGRGQKLSLAATLARITSEPARVLGIASGRLAAGAPADLVDLRPRRAVHRRGGEAEKPGQEHALSWLRAGRPGALHDRGRQSGLRIMRRLLPRIGLLVRSAPAARRPIQAATTRMTARTSGRPPTSTALPTRCRRAEPLHKFANRPYKALGKEYVPMTSLQPFRQRGLASWYGKRYHGQKTSSGEVYDMYQMTAAHPTLPIPSYARVTNAKNGKSVVVRINDRGPFHAGRVIDLSYVAAYKLGYIQAGEATVELESIIPGRSAGL